MKKSKSEEQSEDDWLEKTGRTELERSGVSKAHVWLGFITFKTPFQFVHYGVADIANMSAERGLSRNPLGSLSHFQSNS